MRYERFLNIAAEYAKTSPHEFRHGSIIVKAGRIVGSGINTQRYTSNLPKKIDDSIWEDLNTSERRDYLGRIANPNVHAEVDAILCTKANLKGATMYVARINAKGQMAMSRPCAMCRQFMQKHGIDSCVYSISNNEWGILKI
jgi:deoxycytidylate deaminase